MLAVQVRVFGRSVEWRGKAALVAASSESWGRVYVLKGAIDGLELLLPDLEALLMTRY
jgi:hypothetical protein